MAQPAAMFETKSDFAYRLVRDEILSGALPPGGVIQQRELAARLGISMTPLREAMRRLLADDLVELDSHRDARVTEVRAEEARDLVEMRRALDLAAAALAAERRTTEDIAAMRASLAALEPLPGQPTVDQLQRHRAFHSAIYRASHDQLLVDSLESLWDNTDRYRRLALQEDPTPETLEAKADEHRLLVEHVVAGDVDGARELMRAHDDRSHGARAAWRLRSRP